MTGSHIVVVTTTVGNKADADTIAEALIASCNAACVQSWPIRSRYRWEGAVVNDEEIRVEAKTSPQKAELVAAQIAALHPYDLPELATTQIIVSGEYAKWVDAQTT